MKLLLVAKHPESCQNTYDLVDYLLQEDPHCQITVYGVQNTTQNKTRAFKNTGVRYIDVDDNGNKLDIDVLHRELTASRYDVMVVVHTINIVTTIVKSLEGTLEGLPTKVLMYCEVPRDFPHRKYFDSLRSLFENPKLHGKIRVATPSKHGAKLIDKHVQPAVATAMPYGIVPGAFYAIPRDVARAAIELRGDDQFVVFCVGRIDTSIMTFASFVATNPGLKAKLMLPIEENMTDVVKEMYLNEMAIARVSESQAMEMLVLLKDVAYMNNDELNVLVAASNVVVHTNPLSDMNVYAYQFALTGVPQVVPDNSFNTEYMDKSLITRVPTTFDFYSFDEYGGRLSLCSHTALAAALSASLGSEMTQQSMLDKARSLVSYLNHAVTNQLSWHNWKQTLDDMNRPQHAIKPHHHHFGHDDKNNMSNEIDALKSKLTSLLLKIGK